MQGIIVKGIAGFYYVKTESMIIECKARGKFRHNELTPLIGDIVEIDAENDKGIINEIYERRNSLIRPAVSNVTQAFVVFSLQNPDINVDLVNKFLIQCEYNHIKAIVCLNKVDLVNMENYKSIINMIHSSGYKYLLISAKEGLGISELKKLLPGNVTVICGPSGSGKSTLLNKIFGKDVMEVGNISEKLKRGKHTTRHSELVEIDGGLLMDTPGFSSLDIDFISIDELEACFPEFSDYIGMCNFTHCLHYKEPNCAVKKAVEEKKIDQKRYDFYIKILLELQNRRKRK